jgi:hypothetical protein
MANKPRYKIFPFRDSDLESVLNEAAAEGYGFRQMLAQRVLCELEPQMEALTGMAFHPAIDEHALRRVIEAALDPAVPSEKLAEVLVTRILAAHGAGGLLEQ